MPVPQAVSRQQAAQAAFGGTYNSEGERAWFAETVGPALARFTLPVVARATGASTSSASKWRAGRAVPHRRHFAALAHLVGVEWPEEVHQ